MRFRRALLAGVVATMTLAGCTQETFDPCKVNPTYLNEQGQCMEADDERCDDDPCDADDFDGHKPSPKATKPRVSTTKRR